jgi:hypothetical protein
MMMMLLDIFCLCPGFRVLLPSKITRRISVTFFSYEFLLRDESRLFANDLARSTAKFSLSCSVVDGSMGRRRLFI